MKDFEELVSVPQLDQSELYSKWKKFINGVPLGQEKIFNETLMAWQRCADLGISPYNLRIEELSKEELSYRQGKLTEVLKLLDAHIETVKKTVSTHSTSYCISVADRDGYIMMAINEPGPEPIPFGPGLSPGRCFAEKYVGNNAIGTVLATGQPIAVIGPEHYVQTLHRLSCVGAPIFDISGEIIAVIEITTPTGFESPYTFSLLVAVATAVQAGLRQNLVERQLKETSKVLDQILQQRDIIFNSMSQGVVILNKDGVVIFFNKAAEKIWDLKSEEVDGKAFDCLFQDKCPRQEPLLIKTISEGIAFTNIECKCRNNRERKNLLVNTSLLVDENNAVAGVIGIYTDVTELRRQEERIKEQEKLAVVGQMAAGMAHEIRNPLTSVRGFAQLMSEKQAIDQAVLKEYLEIMINDIDQADGFINHFLQLSRPKPPVKKVSLINDLINDFVRIFESQAFLQGTKVNTQLKDVPPVIMDANQIKQVLLNLCQNSLQALRLGGALTLTTTYISKEKMVRIEIIDNGPGISPVNLKKIGIPFFTTKDTGTGLGLSISYSIVDKHQGRIEVESQEGSGTRFSIYLPVDEQ
ncbi:ATP-binding protein [Desulforamulus aquiferis]|uniref:histidine kinase n=1 Tax=Desulforamulus aquiferis TaxID=1397668 RepID=A0AAW7ZAV7_9FIRM|nr:ATP-binding protein [Desulforamulus aquiferis]MDO7786472.1 ATP-binding protein [Desulforamulus aquiferis]